MLGALPDNKSSILYSLGALTTFGHTDLFLAAHWQLMGALEALNGVILFGLTTAFLYGMIQRVWLAEAEEAFLAKTHSRRKRDPDGYDVVSSKLCSSGAPKKRSMFRLHTFEQESLKRSQ
jgi:hypothetical protein